MNRPLLLLALVNSIFGCFVLSALVLYRGDVGIPGKTAVAGVLSAYVIASVCAARGSLRVLEFAIRVVPMLALLGTASGFLIAFSGDTADVQQRVAGASTGLAATIAGIACTCVLMLQREILEPKRRVRSCGAGCGCGR